MEYIDIVKNALEEKLARNIKVLDVSMLTPISDTLIIADASNVNQLDALVDSVQDELGKAGYFHKAVEGNKNCGWVLLDYVDFIVHLFTTEAREHYNLERIWSDAKEI